MITNMDRQLGVRLTFILLPFWSGFLISGMNGMKKPNVTLVVPQVILQGETLIMDCRFPANWSSQVYSVKWYKGTREFFRFTSRENPRVKMIPFKNIDIHVDENQSDMNKIVLKAVPAEFRGNITCEVTFEPNYNVACGTRYLQVAVPPERPPVLSVDVVRKKSYENSASVGLSNWSAGKNEPVVADVVNIGDTLVVKCTSGPSTPPMDVNFMINDGALTLYMKKTDINEELIEDAENKTATKIATFNMTLQFMHFNNRKISIKCNAKLYNLYNEFSNEIVKELPKENTVKASSYGGFGSGAGSRYHMGIVYGNMVLLPVVVLLLMSPTVVFCR